MLVTLNGLGHQFSDASPWLFRDLDYTFAPGTVTAVVGPSGTGKSTLLSLLSTALTPAEGVITFSEPLSVARVSQAAHGVASRAVIDHVCLPLLAQGYSRRMAVPLASEIAGEFGLGELLWQPYYQLSGGEAQRLMLARAVAMNASLILADEPTASLDAANAMGVIAVLGRLARLGSTVVVATHDLRSKDACDATLDLGDYATAGGQR
jgi:lipoprotein-releasing system ATP-binding protein